MLRCTGCMKVHRNNILWMCNDHWPLPFQRFSSYHGERTIGVTCVCVSHRLLVSKLGIIINRWVPKWLIPFSIGANAPVCMCACTAVIRL